MTTNAPLRVRLDDFEGCVMTTPLILQIQEAALDSKSSVTDALRKAKIACVKLELAEFGNWVDLELNGYIGKVSEPRISQTSWNIRGL